MFWFMWLAQHYHHSSVPVCTLSPMCSWYIGTDFPFSRETLANDGKHSWLGGGVGTKHKGYIQYSVTVTNKYRHI